MPEGIDLTQSTSWNVDAPTPPAIPSPCYDDGRCGPFQRIDVDFMVQGESRITWYLRDTFMAPTPYTFQLQVGETGNPYADDWANVGPSVVNAFTMTDPTRHALGKQLVTYYRVILTDSSSQAYYSLPATVLGKLSFRYWLAVREITRQELLKLRLGPGGRKGFLLKKRRSGTPCPVCLDPNTGEVLNAECPVCKGQRFTAGYYTAYPCHFTDPTPVAIDEQRTSGPAGWTADTVIRGRFLGSPMLTTGDIWVDGSSDLRYYVEKVTVENQVQGVPVTLQCDLYQLPFQNVAYTIALGGG